MPGPPPDRTTPRRSAVATAAALIALAVIATVDIITGEDAILTGAYLLPPLALAVLAAPRVVAGVVAVSLTLAVLSGLWNEYFLTTDHVVRLVIVSSAAALAVLSARARRGMVAARQEADRQRERMEVLAAVGRITDAPALQQALDHLVDALVPTLGDAAWVELAGDRARGRFSALRATGDGGRAIEAWREQRPASSDEASPIARVLRTGEPLLIERIAPDMLTAIHDEADRRALAEYGPRSAIIVPLRARDRIIGALGLLVAGSGRTFGQADREYAETLAGRAALAIANVQLLEEVITTRKRLDGILGTLVEAVTVHDENGQTVYANEAAAELLGAPSIQELLTARPGELAARFDIRHEDGRPVSVDEFPGRRLMAGKDAPPVLTRSINRETGRARWLLTKARLLHEGDRPLAVNVIEDVTEAKDAEIRQRFRAEAGQVLASSLDARAILERLVALLVPTLARWSAIHLVRDDALHAIAHAGDAPPAGLAERARSVMETGDSDVEIDALVIAPMRAGDETLGTLAVGPAGHVGAADVAFFEDLALRAAGAVETARQYEERVRVADTLQRSLLPERLIDVPGWEAGASYQAGERGAEVGGDFYDVIAAGDAHIVVLGDVTGRGVEAAALTSLVRHTARTAVRFDPRPGAVVALLNQVLFEQPRLAPVTLVCARIADGEGAAEVTLSIAGHPLPLLKRAGAVPPVEVGQHDVVLGVARRAGLWSERTIAVGPGETLLFYTDGVTDTPGRDERFGEHRLADVIARAPADPTGLLEAVDRELRSFEARGAADDRAMLALRHVGPSELPDVGVLGAAA